MADDADIAADYQERLNQQAVEARKVYKGASAAWCVECDEVIPQLRRQALPGVKLCIECAEYAEKASRLMCTF